MVVQFLPAPEIYQPLYQLPQADLINILDWKTNSRNSIALYKKISLVSPDIGTAYPIIVYLLFHIP